jgi:hypothetical protein
VSTPNDLTDFAFDVLLGQFSEGGRNGRAKTNLGSILDGLAAKGWKPGLTEDSYRAILGSGLRGKNLPLAAVATEIALKEHPLTLRGLMYRVVSFGWLPSTDKGHYKRLGRIMTTLREEGVVPFSCIVDNVRDTIKPSSWSGIGDFVDTVQEAYRKDFWASLPEYVHAFVEKDAIAGVVEPVTREFDVALSPVRGYVSLSFAHEVAQIWRGIEKPINAYYLGDFDPSGFDLERDLRDKMARYSARPFTWARLAVNEADFDAFGLIPLRPKASDRRFGAFVEKHGSGCAEVDAIPAPVLRQRLRESIEGHIPAGNWERLQEIERQERESFNKAMDKIKKRARHA